MHPPSSAHRPYRELPPPLSGAVPSIDRAAGHLQGPPARGRPPRWGERGQIAARQPPRGNDPQRYKVGKHVLRSALNAAPSPFARRTLDLEKDLTSQGQRDRKQAYGKTARLWAALYPMSTCPRLSPLRTQLPALPIPPGK